MANGIFAPELVAEGWFDETLKPEGWFSQDFLEPASGGGTDATANGATVTTVYSVIPGTATGEVNATAPGATVTAVYSFLAGAASASTDATASGATLTVAHSFVAGTATGESHATASGATLNEVHSFIPGAAEGQQNATAAGKTFGETFSFLGGSAFGESQQAQDFDYNDGSTSKSKSIEEVQQELYREYQQGIRDTIAKFSNPPKDEPEAVETVAPDKPLPATLTRLLEVPDTTALADIVSSYDALNAGLDALLDVRQEAQRQQNEDNEIAIMLAMGDL